MCPSVAAEYLRGPACSHEGECECGTTKQCSFKSKQPQHWGPSCADRMHVFFFGESPLDGIFPSRDSRVREATLKASQLTARNFEMCAIG